MIIINTSEFRNGIVRKISEKDLLPASGYRLGVGGGQSGGRLLPPVRGEHGVLSLSRYWPTSAVSHHSQLFPTQSAVSHLVNCFPPSQLFPTQSAVFLLVK
jgi:hypothetical protein